MKRMKRNSILPILVLTSIMGISSCSTDYMAYDVGLKDGIYFITDSVNYQFGMKVGEDFNYAIAVRLLGTLSIMTENLESNWLKKRRQQKRDCIIN